MEQPTKIDVEYIKSRLKSCIRNHNQDGGNVKLNDPQVKAIIEDCAERKFQQLIDEFTYDLGSEVIFDDMLDEIASIE